MGIGKEKIVAVILAGGDSKRLTEHSLPKQLININGKHIVKYCLDIYQNLSVIDSIILVINNKFRTLFEDIINKEHYTKVEKIVPGGERRQESVFNGISAIESCDLVVIQNGVSIFTPPELILMCIETAKIHRAASSFVREVYSSFEFKENRITNALNRGRMGHVRDPQVFDFHLLLGLHKKAQQEKRELFTNDVILLKYFGHEVYLVESTPNNFKITTDLDIKLAHILLIEAKK